MAEMYYHVWQYLGPRNWLCTNCGQRAADATKGSAARQTCPGKR